MTFDKTLLSNGLTVVTVPLKGRPSVSVGLWIHIGGRDEPESLNGISHFLEHLVFKGTRRRSVRDIKEEIEGVGGSLNAFTGAEATCFLARVPKERVKSALDVLCDIVLFPTLKPIDIEKERGVILEEIKMVQDHPAHWAEEILDELFWAGHPLGRPLAGTEGSVSGIQRADLKRYQKDFYTPNLSTLVVAGDVRHADVLRLTRETYKARPSLSKKPYQPVHERLIKKRVKCVRKRVKQVHLALALLALPKGDPREPALRLLNLILGGNMSSRLFHEIREERGLAYEIDSSLKSYHDSGSLVIEAGVDAGKCAEALKAVMQECRRLSDLLVPSAELKRAKTFLFGQMDLTLENTMDVMLWTGEEILTFGKLRRLSRLREELENVTARQIQDLAASVFQDQTLNAVIMGPLKPNTEDSLTKLLTFK